MPSIEDILSQLGNAIFLSKLDLLKGFHQVPMSPESKEYTAFSCPQGKFQYRVMPFGLTNAPSTFQQLMQLVLRGLETFSLPYIDVIIIFSSTFSDHLSHITSVLSRLASAKLSVKPSKCQWCFKAFEFLGFHVGHGRLSIPEARVTHISSMSSPQLSHPLNHFLVLLRFIPVLSPHSHLLHQS